MPVQNERVTSYWQSPFNPRHTRSWLCKHSQSDVYEDAGLRRASPDFAISATSIPSLEKEEVPDCFKGKAGVF